MVRDFTSTELSRMQDAQEDAMQDMCVRMEYAQGSQDAHGKPAETWTEGDSLSCGFDPAAKEEAMEGTEVVMTDAVMRLPLDTTLDNRDRLKVTHRFGEELDTAETFEIIGEAERGPSGLVLNLRKVTDGSES